MTDKDLLREIGNIREEYILEAAPDQDPVLPAAGDSRRKEQERRSRFRRQIGIGFAAAAAALVLIVGPTVSRRAPLHEKSEEQLEMAAPAMEAADEEAAMPQAAAGAAAGAGASAAPSEETAAEMIAETVAAAAAETIAATTAAPAAPEYAAMQQAAMEEAAKQQAAAEEAARKRPPTEQARRQAAMQQAAAEEAEEQPADAQTRRVTKALERKNEGAASQMAPSPSQYQEAYNSMPANAAADLAKSEENVMKDAEVPAETAAEADAEAVAGAPKEAGSAVTDGVFMGNPWLDFASLEEAAASAGFPLVLPEEMKEGAVFRTIPGEILEVITAAKGDGTRFRVRKSPGDADNSGDYNVYPEDRTVSWNGRTYRLRGTAGLVSLVTWTEGDYSYSAAVEDGPGLSEIEMQKVIDSVL